MRLSPSDDDGELKELGEMKAAHLLVKAVKTLQVINKFTNTWIKKSLPLYNTVMCQKVVDANF